MENQSLTKSFPLGKTVITSNALHVLHPLDAYHGLERHSACDWGELDPEDIEANNRAIEEGSRLLSAYHDRHGVKFWVITEADRSVTTVLLPEDY
ncbi:MAG: hypothetical protein AB9869_03720 [Verrucomicrobiia bacterium]